MNSFPTLLEQANTWEIRSRGGFSLWAKSSSIKSTGQECRFPSELVMENAAASGNVGDDDPRPGHKISVAMPIGQDAHLISDGGRGEIRTHETFRFAGFQDRCHQPLGHPSVCCNHNRREHVSGTTVFKTAGINRSPVSPLGRTASCELPANLGYAYSTSPFTILSQASHSNADRSV